MLNTIKFNCLYFRGNIPCVPNKLRDKVCDSCNEYQPVTKRILIIKLGAIGDVIRTTPLIVKYRELYPDCHITWVTHFPEILPSGQINAIYSFDFPSVYAIEHMQFDIAINLEKETEACSLLAEVEATEKYGYVWRDYHIDVATPQAEHKLMTGLFDNISKKNKKHYLEEIFEICHLSFNDEPCLLDIDATLSQKWQILKIQSDGKPVIGLNTGCGKRWVTRLWPNEYWLQLAREITKSGYYPVLLGGEAEDENNRNLAELSGAYYPGHFSLKEFIAITSNCNLLVTQVSMAMHIAIALRIQLVLMNNIFNPNEFYLYNNGSIVEPTSGCDCYYGITCKRTRNCMQDISVEMILNEIKKLG